MSDFLDQVLSATVETLSGAAQVAPAASPVAKPVPSVTKASLLRLLNSDKRTDVVGRALVVLFKRQTDAEKVSNQTKLTNGRGFTQADAFTGTVTAKSYLKNGTLADWQVAKWMKLNRKGEPRILKYWAQLDEAAKEKAGK